MCPKGPVKKYLPIAQAITYNLGQMSFWRERAAFQRSAFGRSTAGNDVVATIFIRIFFLPSSVKSQPSWTEVALLSLYPSSDPTRKVCSSPARELKFETDTH